MDETELQDRLSQLKQRQYLILALLVVPYLLDVAEAIGFWIAGVLFTVAGFGLVAIGVFYRRSSRNAAGQ